MAIIAGDESMLTLLLDNGGSVNEKDAFGMTPIFLALRMSEPKILLPILEHFPDKDARFQGDTALHWAVSSNQIQHVKLLLSYEYSVEVKNQDGKTPIQIAQNRRYGQMLELLDNPAQRQRLIMLPKRQRQYRRVEAIPHEDPPAPVVPRPQDIIIAEPKIEKEVQKPLAPEPTPVAPQPDPAPATPQPEPAPPILHDFSNPRPEPPQAPWMHQPEASPPPYSWTPLQTPPWMQQTPPWMQWESQYAQLTQRICQLEGAVATLLARKQNKCPVCERIFSDSDFKAHVAAGCKH